MNVLIVEDGFEYLNNAERFLESSFRWSRAGSGLEAVSLLENNEFDCILLDMCFDRLADHGLIGDIQSLTERFLGERWRAVEYLQRNQGNFILSHLRALGVRVPVLLSYDFDDEPRRWAHVKKNFGPIDYISDNFSARQLSEKLLLLVSK